MRTSPTHRLWQYSKERKVWEPTGQLGFPTDGTHENDWTKEEWRPLDTEANFVRTMTTAPAAFGRALEQADAGPVILKVNGKSYIISEISRMEAIGPTQFWQSISGAFMDLQREKALKEQQS